MKNPRDKAQIMALASQICQNKTKFLIEAFNDATKNQFGYIKVYMKQDTQDNLRIQTRIQNDSTPEDLPSDCEYSISPIAYASK